MQYFTYTVIQYNIAGAGGNRRNRKISYDMPTEKVEQSRDITYQG